MGSALREDVSYTWEPVSGDLKRHKAERDNTTKSVLASRIRDIILSSTASMTPNLPIEVWILAAFIGSSLGLGFVAGFLATRHTWHGWTVGVGATAVAFVWPALMVVAFLLTTGPCKPRDASDPCDGPAMLFMSIIMISPIVFIVSFVLALGGALFGGWRFDPKRAAEHALGADSP